MGSSVDAELYLTKRKFVLSVGGPSGATTFET
jgi:hypothetical protein